MKFNIDRKLHAAVYQIREYRYDAYWFANMPKCGYAEQVVYAEDESQVTCKNCLKKLSEERKELVVKRL